MPEPSLLERVAQRVPVPDDALERLERRGRKHTRRRRIAAATLALGIAIAAGAGLVAAFGPKKPPVATHPGPVTGTFILFPATSEVRYGPAGALNIEARTNLPDGTRVAISLAQQGGTNLTGHTTVQGGLISIVVRNYNCHQLRDLRVQSRPIHVWIEAAPVVRLPPSCSTGDLTTCVIRQTPRIYGELGRRFQNLHGSQVTHTAAGNQIRVARSYVFPGTTCQSTSGSTSSGASSIPP